MNDMNEESGAQRERSATQIENGGRGRFGERGRFGGGRGNRGGRGYRGRGGRGGRDGRGRQARPKFKGAAEYMQGHVFSTQVERDAEGHLKNQYELTKEQLVLYARAQLDTKSGMNRMMAGLIETGTVTLPTMPSRTKPDNDLDAYL